MGKKLNIAAGIILGALIIFTIIGYIAKNKSDNDFYKCDDGSIATSKELCGELTLEKCVKIKDIPIRNKCLDEIQENTNPKVCEAMSEGWGGRDWCYDEIAYFTGNASWCNYMEYNKDTCISAVSRSPYKK